MLATRFCVHRGLHYTGNHEAIIELISALIRAGLSENDILISLEGLAARFLPHSFALETDPTDVITCKFMIFLTNLSED